MKPEDVIEVIEEMSPYLAVHTEAQLADYGETANGGPYVKFRLADSNELDPFRGQDRAAKNKAGKRYIMMLIEVADDEKPIKQPKPEKEKGGPLSRRAAALCREEEFQLFVKASAPVMWRDAESNCVNPVMIAREYILHVCGIQSRAELDHNEAAAKLFDRSILSPYIREMTI